LKSIRKVVKKNETSFTQLPMLGMSTIKILADNCKPVPTINSNNVKLESSANSDSKTKTMGT